MGLADTNKMAMTNRRAFLKSATTLASGVFLSSLPACNSTTRFNGIGSKFGIQLYTLKDVLPNDPKDVLKQLASFGYKQIESYEGDKGMFWGMKNTDFKNYISDLGMDIIASHCDHRQKDFAHKVDQAAAIGMKYMICPYIGPQKTLDSFKRHADDFNKAGQLCKSRGLKFGYHNHEYTFKKVEGEFPQDVLIRNTDKELVDFEMDMYWVVDAGQDPIDWLKKYPGRFRLAHVKERKGKESATLGTGEIKFATILREAEKQGMKYFFVEQEHYAGTTPLEAAKHGADYMKKLKI